jgi:hypothetical protein
LQDLAHAGAFATMISNFLDEPQRTIELSIEHRPDLQYSFDLLDKIPFTAAKLGIDTTYHVGRIEHKWGEATGQQVITSLVLRPRLTDGTSIGNDPEDPDLPYIPEPAYPPNWPIDTPITPPTPPAPGGTCLLDPAAPPNGPFVIQGPWPRTLYSNGTYVLDVPLALYELYLRPSNFTNTSYMSVTGDWQVWDVDTNRWIGETSSTNWRVTINSAFEGTKQPITDQGTGTRILTLAQGGAQQLMNARFEIDPTVYGRGTGAAEYYMEYVGNYTVEHTAGFYTEFTPTMPTIRNDEYVGIYIDVSVFTDEDATLNRMGCDFWGNTSDVQNSLGGHGYCTNEVAAAFGIPTNRNDAMYYPPTGNSIRWRLSNVGAVTCTLDIYVLYYGSPPPAHRWNIRGMALFNVCGKA